MSNISSIAHSGERRVSVTTGDGVELAVREYGRRDADLTVVLIHGHCLRTESWAEVRDALLREHSDAKVVCYDHRGHGDSAAASRQTYNIEQLAHDLHEVLDIVAPTGPVVLVGHSMGGMTVLTYVDRYRHEVGTRIVGVGLVATAASGLADAGFGRLLRNPIIAGFQAAVRRAPRLMQHVKLLACKVFAPVVRAAEFGDRKVSQRVLTLAEAMHNATSIVTMASFLSAFKTFDRTAALSTLSTIPTLILCGSADLMTPPSHSVAMAAAVDYADFVQIDGAGHSVIFEQPAQVAEAVARLVGRVNRADRIEAAQLVLAA
ncbi:alpha/beta fold hydrolase [Nocardia sp. NPDC058480]|uniref:alpha/beta fold hydrolase n=1 Tax=unclassified Nocardia TaxID=2637762 RepID=UPI0036464877